MSGLQVLTVNAFQAKRLFLAVPVLFNRTFSSAEAQAHVHGRNQKHSSPTLEHPPNGINNCPDSCLCSNNITFDYKNARLLSQFTSSQTGVIFPRTVTKICRKKQRELAKAIKRARIMGFMPFTTKIPQYISDPKLF